MEGHPYLIKGIPKALWKEFQIACIYFETTAKDHLITCMSDLVLRYHKVKQNTDTAPMYDIERSQKK